jgi:hypothetical protein
MSDTNTRTRPATNLVGRRAWISLHFKTPEEARKQRDADRATCDAWRYLGAEGEIVTVWQDKDGVQAHLMLDDGKVAEVFVKHLVVLV